MVPVSTALSDPFWFRPPEGKQWYIDKRGIIFGLRYEPLIVQSQGSPDQYRDLLDTVDFNRMIKGFEFCLNKFNCDTIVLMVYESPDNPFSERSALQDYFTCNGYKCEELKYPIK